MPQHWVPRHILSGFADEKGNVQVYYKDGRPSRYRHINRASTGERGTKRQNSDSVERLMGSIESAFKPLLDIFRTFEGTLRITQEAKMVAAIYIAMFLTKRSPSLHEASKTYLDDKPEAATNAATLALGDRSGLEGNDARLFDSVVRKPSEVVPNDQNDFWNPFAISRYVLSRMTFRIAQSDDIPFAVPDRGLAWPRDIGVRRSDPVHDELHGPGLFSPENAYYYPISENRALVLTWKAGPADVVEVVKVPLHS